MWTLFVLLAGLSQPVQLDGFTSKKWCDEVGAQMVQDFGPLRGAFTCVKLPPRA